MNKIIFTAPVLRTNITKGETFTHTFTGKNLGSEIIKVKSAVKGCSCTSLEYKEEILPDTDFEVKMSVLKDHAGLFSVSVTLTFDNNQSQTLNINGKVE